FSICDLRLGDRCTDADQWASRRAIWPSSTSSAANRTSQIENPTGSGKNSVNHFAENIRQPHVAARKAEREFRVVQAQQVQHRGMQVMDVDFVLDGFVAVFVSGAIKGATLDAAACQPDREAERVVITPVRALGEG